MPNYYKPITWENRSNEPTVDLTNLCAMDSRLITINNSECEIKPMKPISYTCKNCNGHINPQTMKCEYCDTQY